MELERSEIEVEGSLQDMHGSLVYLAGQVEALRVEQAEFREEFKAALSKESKHKKLFE